MVSIIILSFNTKILLQACLKSVYAKVNDIDFEVIVVDNNSRDDSVEMVRKNFKTVKLIENKDNLGFGKAINKAALIAQGKFLFFLNSDTYVLKNGLKEMLSYLENNPDIGVLGGCLESKDGTIQKSAGKFFHLLNVFLLLIGFERIENTKDEEDRRIVDWVNGACMLIRTKLFEAVMGFDEYFFMYMEDMELCYRVQAIGYKIMYDPSLRITHVGQGSSNRSFAILHIYKGLLYFYKKHKNTWEYIVVKLLLELKAFLAIGVGSITGNVYLRKTYIDALKIVI